MTIPQTNQLNKTKDQLNFWIQQIIQEQQRFKDYLNKRFGLSTYFTKQTNKTNNNDIVAHACITLAADSTN